MRKKHTKSAREIKEEKVQSLTEKIERAKTLTFADYRGLTANQIAQLRKKIKEADGEFIVEKNNLIKIALKNNKLAVENETLLTGPTAAIFAFGDEIAPIRESAENAKTLGLPSFKFGFFGKIYLDSEGVEKLSKIPGRDILQGKVVSTLSSPLYGIVSVLQANISKLVFALDQIKTRKAGE
jgi:large subunit ribosomal protein L10